MKTLKITTLFAFFMAITSISFAQTTKTETFKVSGNCGMCKSKIEKAAKEAGATYASWDADTKDLTVKYKSTSTNAAKIQQKIAGVGYDNAGFKATDDTYNKLHGCCKYDRTADEKADCCAGHEKCEMKDGKCTDMSACKDKGCCDANGVCKGSCSHEAGHEGKMDCCKDGKCSKPGHDGKDCCKKS
jgi:mercuric ion binding protein